MNLNVENGKHKFDINLKQALTDVGWKAHTELKKAIEYFTLDFENGSEPESMSVKNFGFTGKLDLFNVLKISSS